MPLERKMSEFSVQRCHISVQQILLEIWSVKLFGPNFFFFKIFIIFLTGFSFSHRFKGLIFEKKI